MPRFYFDLIADDQTVKDEVGSEFKDVGNARTEAINTILEASRFTPSDDEKHRFEVRVHDTDRKTIFEISNVITHRWVK